MRRALLIWLILCCSAAAEYDGNLLNVTNPFYEPYSGDIFIRNDWSNLAAKTDIEIPQQTFFPGGTPVNWPAANMNSTQSEQTTQVVMKVGIADWFSIGASGKYMLQSTTETNSQGGLGLQPNSTEKKSGFHEPYFSASFRFAGTERNDWYLSTELRYQPGLNIGGASSPQSAYTAITGLGWNTDAWTFGLVSILRYEEASGDKDSVPTKAFSPLLLVQYDFQPFYVRGMGGTLRAFSSRIESNWQPLVRGEVGFLMGDNTSLCFIIDQRFPVSTTTTMNTLTTHLNNKGALNLSVAFLTGF